MKIPSDWISFTQPWQETPDAEFQQSRVQLRWKNNALILEVELTDAQIISGATAHNQRLFLLGDTLEVFLKRPELDSYLELHVDPQNFRTALRWPPGGIESCRESDGTPLENFQIDPECFGSRVENFPGGWRVEVSVPPQLLDWTEFAPGQSLLVSVCRYDYAESDGTPILSTISSHEVKNFHDWTDWLVFATV